MLLGWCLQQSGYTTITSSLSAATKVLDITTTAATNTFTGNALTLSTKTAGTGAKFLSLKKGATAVVEVRRRVRT